MLNRPLLLFRTEPPLNPSFRLISERSKVCPASARDVAETAFEMLIQFWQSGPRRGIQNPYSLFKQKGNIIDMISLYCDARAEEAREGRGFRGKSGQRDCLAQSIQGGNSAATTPCLLRAIAR